MQNILTSRVAVLGAGAACLLAANVQTGSMIKDYYKGQVMLSLLAQRYATLQRSVPGSFSMIL